MKGPLWLLAWMAVHVTVGTLESGIDKGFLECSREKGSDVTQAEKGDHGSVVSGDFPGNYSIYGKGGVWCLVQLQVCSTCRIRLAMTELSLPACAASRNRAGLSPDRDWCYPGCDHIHIHEVDPPYSDVTHRDYFHSNEGDEYTSISSNVEIRHCVGNSSTDDPRRFKVDYKVIDNSRQFQGVVSQYESSVGVIESPNFPHGYALNGETFTFMIQNLDPYGHVRLVFEDWDIAPETKVKVYDGFSENSPSEVLSRHSRPVLVSETNSLVLVLSTGDRKSGDCCYYKGFKANYQFVSEEEWTTKPDTSCSGAFPLQGGDTLSFKGSNAFYPSFYDCVWLIKRYNSLNTADAVVLRLREVLLGDGWLQFEKQNLLEIRAGVTSQAPLLASFTARNLTDIRQSYTSYPGMYIRLRGGFYSTDMLSFLFTAVRNVSEDGNGCPGYFDYLCHNMWCIEQELLCDQVDHCGDGSDESPSLDCSMSDLWRDRFKWNNIPYLAETDETSETEATDDTALPPCDGIRCGRRCIQISQLCDLTWDCEAGEDEENCVHKDTPMDTNTGSRADNSYNNQNHNNNYNNYNHGVASTSPSTFTILCLACLVAMTTQCFRGSVPTTRR